MTSAPLVAVNCPQTCVPHASSDAMKYWKVCSTTPLGNARPTTTTTTTTTTAAPAAGAEVVMKTVTGEYSADWALPADTTPATLLADTSFVGVIAKGLSDSLNVPLNTVTITGFEVAAVASGNSTRQLAAQQMTVKSKYEIVVNETKAAQVVATASATGFAAQLKTATDTALTTAFSACSPNCAGAFSEGKPTMATPTVPAPTAAVVTTTAAPTSGAAATSVAALMVATAMFML